VLVTYTKTSTLDTSGLLS